MGKKKFDSVLYRLGDKVQTSNSRLPLVSKIQFVQNPQNMCYADCTIDIISALEINRIYFEKTEISMSLNEIGSLQEHLPFIYGVN